MDTKERKREKKREREKKNEKERKFVSKKNRINVYKGRCYFKTIKRCFNT
jgi:pyruvate/2-oxoglutarate dehydrogenase complex dihydrolipoamide dehydrogenase (E3) component